MKNRGSYLTIDERIRIKRLLDQNATVAVIAETLNRSRQTIYTEIGSSEKSYDPYLADQLAKERSKNKGRSQMITLDPDLRKLISKMILEEELTVPQISNVLSERSSSGLTVSLQTIYRYIKKGEIPGVTMESLHQSSIKMGQDNVVHIPEWLCQKCGFSKGDDFEISVSSDGSIMLKKVT
ncbi:transposase [Oscillibacter ruminantium]